MKIIIFGASGSVGRHLVDQALTAGHSVTAFGRNPSVLTADQPIWYGRQATSSTPLRFCRQSVGTMS